MSKQKKKTKWRKKRHGVVFTLLRPAFRLYLKLRYNYTAKKCDFNLPPAALIYCNHTTVLDPFMVAVSFKRPIFYMMNDDLFTLGFLSKVIKFLVNPIPKSKSKSDINAVKYTLKVLKEGATVGIFPEGNRTLSGANWELDDSSARLAKKAKVPLVLYNISGGYGSDPRWGGSVRRGKMTGEVVKVLSVEDLEKMSVEEIHEQILTALKTKDLELGWEFNSKKRAEFLERSAYYCPNCGAFNSIYTRGSEIFCKCCSLKAEYTKDLKLLPIEGNLPYKNTKEWFYDQQEKLKEKLLGESVKNIFSDRAEVRIVKDGKRRKLGELPIEALPEINEGDRRAIKVGNYFVTRENTDGATVLGKRKINFYLKNGETLQVKGAKRFNAVKYLHLYQLLPLLKEGEEKTN